MLNMRWASCKPVKLQKPCSGPPDDHTESKAARVRVAKGRHPIGSKGCLSAPLIAIRADHKREVESMIDNHLAAPKRKAKLVPIIRMPSAAEQFLGSNAPGPSDDGQTPGRSKLNALQDRMRAKSNGASRSHIFS